MDVYYNKANKYIAPHVPVKEYNMMETHDISNAFDRFKKMYVDDMEAHEAVKRSLTASEIRLKQLELDIEAKIDTNRFRESMANYVKVLNNNEPDNSNSDEFLSKEDMEIE